MFEYTDLPYCRTPRSNVPLALPEHLAFLPDALDDFSKKHDWVSYCVLFGSSVLGKISDIDIKFYAHRVVSDAELFATVDFVRKINQGYGKQSDKRSDIPFMYKLIQPLDILVGAVSLQQFGPIDVGKLEAMPQDPALLRLPKYQMRIALNIMTTPHILLCGDSTVWSGMITLAGRALLRLTSRTHGCGPSDIDALIHSVIGSGPFKDHEHHLGYRDVPYVRQNLKALFQEALKEL